MSKDHSIYIADMLEAIEQAQSATASMNLAEFSKAMNWQTRYAVQRCIEIISEASRHLPDEAKKAYDYPYWREVAGIGNVLRHEYRFVADEIIWNVVKEHLPGLRQVLLSMRADQA